MVQDNDVWVQHTANKFIKITANIDSCTLAQCSSQTHSIVNYMVQSLGWYLKLEKNDIACMIAYIIIEVFI